MYSPSLSGSGIRWMISYSVLGFNPSKIGLPCQVSPSSMEYSPSSIGFTSMLVGVVSLIAGGGTSCVPWFPLSSGSVVAVVGSETMYSPSLSGSGIRWMISYSVLGFNPSKIGLSCQLLPSSMEYSPSSIGFTSMLVEVVSSIIGGGTSCVP